MRGVSFSTFILAPKILIHRATYPWKSDSVCASQVRHVIGQTPRLQITMKDFSSTCKQSISSGAILALALITFQSKGIARDDDDDHHHHDKSSKHHHSDHVERTAHSDRDHNIVHRHSGYVLTLGDGFRGRGYYYGPPRTRFYREGPDVAFYTTREEVPTEYTSYETVYEGGSVGGESVRVQKELARRGYYHGAIDGAIGPASRSAIRGYQADHHLHITGTISPSLVQSLEGN